MGTLSQLRAMWERERWLQDCLSAVERVEGNELLHVLEYSSVLDLLQPSCHTFSKT